MNFVKRYFRGKFNEIRDWNDPDGRKESMPCDEILLEGVDRPLYEKLLARAVAEGTVFTGDTAMLHGITLQWLWDETSAHLRITPLQYPWWARCPAIEEEIQKIVANAKKGAL
jgi:hypothetical protein